MRHKGVALLLTVFVVALLAAVVIGLLQLCTQDTQMMGNHVHAAEALAVAQAGLNDAFAEIRADSSWSAGFTDKAFDGGSYTVLVRDDSTDSVPPSQTDGELEVEALGSLYPGVTQDFAVYHPNLSGSDFDSRAKITINAGSYRYTGGMNGSPFTLSIPLDATSVSFKIVLKELDYPEIPANINAQVSWDVDSEGSTSAYPTIISEGTSADGYLARVSADISIGWNAPHSISISEIRVNE
ncbi:MAG: hypothetical protein GY809_11985 [Planctomycetes bacterium]|nr:hypothetical protein [Planctomycetota bacterium]